MFYMFSHAQIAGSTKQPTDHKVNSSASVYLLLHHGCFCFSVSFSFEPGSDILYVELTVRLSLPGEERIIVKMCRYKQFSLMIQC